MASYSWNKGRLGEQAASQILLNHSFAVKKPDFQRDYKNAIDLYIQEVTEDERWDAIQIKHNLQIKENHTRSFLQKDLVDRDRNLHYLLTLEVNPSTGHYTAYLIDMALMKIFYEKRLKLIKPSVNKEYQADPDTAPSSGTYWVYDMDELILFCKKETSLDPRLAIRKLTGQL